MINVETPIEAWLEIHYRRNKGHSNIKVTYPTERYMRFLKDVLKRNEQPFETVYGEDYLIAYPK